METITTTKPKRRFPDATWREVEKRACAGIPLQTLSEAFGIGIATLNDRSKRYAWQTPARLARKRGAALCEGKSEIVAGAIRGQTRPDGQADETAVPDCITALAALASAPPAEFQAALVPVMQHLLARGLQGMPPPRTVADVKTAVDIHRRAAGLDSKDGGRGVFVLVSPLRTVTRRPGRLVDAGACDPA